MKCKLGSCGSRLNEKKGTKKSGRQSSFGFGPSSPAKMTGDFIDSSTTWRLLLSRETTVNDEDRLAILARAQGLGLRGAGGECAEVAIAINELWFEGRGELVAVANKYRWRQGRITGHVGVRVGDSIWDYEGAFDGEEGLEDFMSWGMLALDDPTWNLPSEEAADEVVFLRNLDPEKLRLKLPFCGVVDPWLALRRALRERRAGMIDENTTEQ